MDILYYSNLCNYSKNLINTLSKKNIKNKIYFICIDKRKKVNNQLVIVLENGKEIPFPNSIKSVPSLVLYSRGNMIIEGNDIYNHINSFDVNNNIEEPTAFSSSFSNFVSDSYSFIDTSIDDFDSKNGNAGMMQMHNFVGINYVDKIYTPPDDYVPDKVKSDDNSLESLIKKRNEQIPNPIKPI
jgi:hypothetical protein